MEEATGDLEKRQAEYEVVTSSLLEVGKRLSCKNRRLQIFDSFLGIVKSLAIEKLETFAADAAYFVNWSGI